MNVRLSKRPGERPGERSDEPEIELDLSASPKEVFLAITHLAQRAGCAIEVANIPDEPGSRCRITARPADAARSLGAAGLPPTVFEFRATGKGLTRVRITQHEAIERQTWEDVLASWSGAGQPPLRRPSGRPQPPGIPGPFPAPAFPGAAQRPETLPRDPRQRALVQKLDLAVARLAALRREAARG